MRGSDRKYSKMVLCEPSRTRKANEGYEIKEFIYKIADIHGRIVTTK